MSRLRSLTLVPAILVSAFVCAQKPFSEEHAAKVAALECLLTPATPARQPEAWETWTTVDNYAFGKNRGNIPMIADLQSLHPYFRDRIIELIRQCKVKGIELAVVETYRTPAKQDEYKGMGKDFTRSSGGRSKHQYGLAVDLVPVIDGQAEWHNAAIWKKVGIIGEKLGLRWGGRWRRLYDPGHFEWTGGLTITHIAGGMYPQVPSKDYPCIDDDLKQLAAYWKSWEVQQSSIALERKEASTSMK